MDIIKPDAVFFDPPWGGPEYKKQDKMDLFLGDKNIVDIIQNMMDGTTTIAMRLPFNYNFDSLNTAVAPESREYVQVGRFTLAIIR